MPHLIFTTLLWAFSFSLIGEFLAGRVDSYFSVLTRVALATLIFLPFIRWSASTLRLKLYLMGIGAIQLGLMYVFYYQSFLLLSVPEVLLFTILTPIYVTLIADLYDRNFHISHLATALLAVAGAYIIRASDLSPGFILGFFVVQGANLCFAFGQVSYTKLKRVYKIDDRANFGWFYLGALAVVTPLYFALGRDAYPTTSLHWGILLWLGIIASGVGYFLWNKGATLVDAGTLAIMNNLLIPAGLLVNLTIWSKDLDLMRWSIGGAIIVMALILHRQIQLKRAL